MINVDHFKKVNDSYGHDIGDKTLCKLAEIMQSYFRKSDLLGRFEGEEFIIISGSFLATYKTLRNLGSPILNRF